MRYILLLLLLLLPSATFSQTNYDISCENAANIRITNIIDTPGDTKSKIVHFYVVRIELKTDATDLFSRFVKEARTTFIDKNGVGHAERELVFTANGALLKTDTPDFIGFDERGVTLGTTQEQEAVNTARSVCPALTPQRDELVHENYAVPPNGASELAFDISCENVNNTVITHSSNPFLKQRAPDGIVHGVLFSLKSEAQPDFQTFVAASRERLATTSAKALPPFTPIQVTTGGRPLRNDLLGIRAYGGTKICTFLFREADALALAREVCPTAPVRVFRPPAPTQPITPPGARGPNPAR